MTLYAYAYSYTYTLSHCDESWLQANAYKQKQGLSQTTLGSPNPPQLAPTIVHFKQYTSCIELSWIELEWTALNWAVAFSFHSLLVLATELPRAYYKHHAKTWPPQKQLELVWKGLRVISTKDCRVRLRHVLASTKNNTAKCNGHRFALEGFHSMQTHVGDLSSCKGTEKPVVIVPYSSKASIFVSFKSTTELQLFFLPI